MKCYLIVRRGEYTIGTVKMVLSNMLPVEEEEVEGWTFKTYLARKFTIKMPFILFLLKLL